MKIFKTLLECAYGLDVLYFEESKPEVYVDVINEKVASKGSEQSCYMLTNCGDIEIMVEHNIDIKGIVSFSSKFENNIKSVEDSLIQSLIKTQLETEAFLGYDNYEEIVCSCELAH